MKGAMRPLAISTPFSSPAASPAARMTAKARATPHASEPPMPVQANACASPTRTAL